MDRSKEPTLHVLTCGIGITTPQGRYLALKSGAIQYLDASITLQRMKDQLTAPMYMSAFHSIELLLKALLAKSGKSLEDLRRKPCCSTAADSGSGWCGNGASSARRMISSNSSAGIRISSGSMGFLFIGAVARQREQPAGRHQRSLAQTLAPGARNEPGNPLPAWHAGFINDQERPAAERCNGAASSCVSGIVAAGVAAARQDRATLTRHRLRTASHRGRCGGCAAPSLCWHPHRLYR